MKTVAAQVKINLSPSLKDFVESRAERFELPLAGYIRFLILKDVEAMGFPVFEASEVTLKRAKQALKNLGKAKNNTLFGTAI